MYYFSTLLCPRYCISCGKVLVFLTYLFHYKNIYRIHAVFIEVDSCIDVMTPSEAYYLTENFVYFQSLSYYPYVWILFDIFPTVWTEDSGMRRIWMN